MANLLNWNDIHSLRKNVIDACVGNKPLVTLV